jgi:hypothetical protein
VSTDAYRRRHGAQPNGGEPWGTYVRQSKRQKRRQADHKQVTKAVAERARKNVTAWTTPADKP